MKKMTYIAIMVLILCAVTFSLSSLGLVGDDIIKGASVIAGGLAMGCITKELSQEK